MAGLRWRLAGIAAVLWLAGAPLQAAPMPFSVPLPPRRDASPAPDLKGQAPSASPSPETYASPDTSAPPEDPGEAADCAALLASGKVAAERQAAVGGPGGCGIALPLRVGAIVTAGGERIVLEPAPVMRCAFVDALADWMRDDLAPLLASRGGGLTRLKGTGGYECRGRNRLADAKRSQHASGNALDIQAFVLADGTIADITQTARDPILFAQVKLTACARFATVLGPGSDGYHEDNLHLDLEPRRNGAHYCHWQLP